MKNHAIVISGHLRFIERRINQLKSLVEKCDIFVITNKSQTTQVEDLKSEVECNVVYCEDVEWAREAEDKEAQLKRRTVYQWVKYKLACQVIKEIEIKYSRPYKYIHKIRTDCNYQNLESLVSDEHCNNLDSFDGLFAETDYSWSGKRDYALKVENMFDYFMNEIINSSGSFRAKPINLTQLKSSDINFWKVGSFITAIRQKQCSEREWVEIVEGLASKNLHDECIKEAVIDCYSGPIKERLSEIQRKVNSPEYLQEWVRCESDNRAAYNNLFFVRFLGNISAPSEVAFAYFLNEQGIVVKRAKPLIGFLNK